MNPNKALWEKGDFTRIAQSMRESGEAVVESLGVNSGLKVLDLGCGDGTTALPAARRGADVLGVDIARNLVEAGNRRAQEHGLPNLRFQAGDACNLSELAADTFDLVGAFRRYYGPTMNAFEAAEKNGRATDLQKELVALFENQNQSPTPGTTSIPATFLRVTVRA